MKRRVSKIAALGLVIATLTSCGVFDGGDSYHTIANEFNMSEDRIAEFVDRVNEGDRGYVLSSLSSIMKGECPSFEKKVDDLMIFLRGSFVGFSEVPGNGASKSVYFERQSYFMHKIKIYAHYTFETSTGDLYRMRMHWVNQDDFHEGGEGTDYIFIEHYKGDGTYTPWSGEEYGIEIGE